MRRKTLQNGYYLWVSSRNVSNPQTYDDYKSEGVCIHKSWCDKLTCSTCTEKTLHTFKWHGQNATDEICYNKSSLEQPESNTDPEQYVNMEPEQNDESVIIPKNDVPPAIPPKTCKLTFSNGTQIDNVVSAYSAKRDLARTRYNTLNRNAHPDIASLYRDYQNNYIRQNVDATGLNYNIQTPHLFDLTKINNIDIPKDQSKRLKSAGYVSFNCDSENPFIIEEPRATASIVCTAKFECKTATIFDQLDPDLDNYFVRSYVWKDAEGNFNTARLISDSVAGVVLGTVGGVVTSSIVKKNQVKKGFESLKCTIGGQDIATYGDEFTIGLK